MNKKGFIGDVFPILMMLFLLAFIGVLMTMILGVFKDAIVNDATMPAEAQSIITNGEEGYPKAIDFWFVLFMVGLPLAASIMAYFNNIHPLFFWASLLLVVVIVLLGASLAELWGQLRSDADLSVAVERFPMSDYILQHYGLYSLFAFVTIAFGTFVKLRGGGGFYS